MIEISSGAGVQQKVLRSVLRAQSGSSLFAQLGLRRLSGFKDFEGLYQGFCRAVPVQGPKVFMDSLAKMLPQSSMQPLQVLQYPNLLLKGRLLAACNWHGVPLPLAKQALADHVGVERMIRKSLAAQGVNLKGGGFFYLFEQEEARKRGGGDELPVPLVGWHELCEGQRWFWEKNNFKPLCAGLPQGGSRWQWFNAMFDQLKTFGRNVEILVTHPKTLIDFGLYVSQQNGRFVPLRELMPNLKVLALNHYDIGLQRTEMGYLLAGLPNVRWMQWLYNPAGVQAWQGDINIRQRLEVLLDGQTFYEFVPAEDIDPQGRLARGHSRFHAGQVEMGREYCLVVSSVSGLLGVSTGMIMKVMSVDPLQLIAKGPVLKLNGLTENLREDAVVEALGNINSALAGHGVFIRDGLFGHIIADRQPVWVLEVSRPLAELNNGVLESIAKRLHAELDLRCEPYRKAYRAAAFKTPKVHFVPMGTFAAAFTSLPEFTQFDHSADASQCKKVLAAAWDTRVCEAV